MDQLSVSQFKLSGRSGQAALDSQVNAVVEVTNNNKYLGFKYKQIDFEIWAAGQEYDDTFLCQGSSTGFEQGGNNVTIIKSKINMESKYMDKETAEEIVGNAREGSLMVDIQVSTSVKVLYKDWKWSFVHVPVRFLCKSIEVGAAKGASKKKESSIKKYSIQSSETLNLKNINRFRLTRLIKTNLSQH
ncbi:hypothetical protein LUZ60_015452 [Juncus effusus]|nr:hypothetical protein LUZ60_015452 [Juncus effusus]